MTDELHNAWHVAYGHETDHRASRHRLRALAWGRTCVLVEWVIRRPAWCTVPARLRTLARSSR